MGECPLCPVKLSRVVTMPSCNRLAVKQNVQHFVVQQIRQNPLRNSGGVEHGTDRDRMVHGVIVTQATPTSARAPAQSGDFHLAVEVLQV